MPAEKTARSAERRRLRNRRVRSATRTIATRAAGALRKGDASEAEPLVNQAIKTLDQGVTKGILHRNNVARKKSRLMGKLNSLKPSD